MTVQSQAARYTVGDLVAEFLAAAGVTTAFGVVSVHNIPILDAIGRRNLIRFVPARGEMGAGHMADAYARVSGGIGVLITSTGPAAASAVPALLEARSAGVPVLHITGQTATRFLGRDTGAVHNVPGQDAMLRSICKDAFCMGDAGSAWTTLQAAFEAAMTPPRGPVSVQIPIDLQGAAVARPAALDGPALALPQSPPPDQAALDAAADLLAGTRRPLLWLGQGARHCGPEVQALMALGVGVVTSWSGRGIVAEDDPRTLGALNGNGSPLVEAFYATVDVLVVAGSRLNGLETMDGALRLPPTIVHIDADPAAENRTYTASLFVRSDAKAALDGLGRRLAHRLHVDPAFLPELARTKHLAAEAYRATLGPYAELPAAFRRAMPRNTVFVRDATIAAYTWGHRLLPLYGPHDSVYPVASAIGPGLPFAIGAALAAGAQARKTVALLGDGGFVLNMAELWTAAQEGAELCIVVMNDRCYTAITQLQDQLVGGRRYFSKLDTPDFTRLAELAGLHATRVDSIEALERALATALGARGPALIEFDVTAIGPVPDDWLTAFLARPAAP